VVDRHAGREAIRVHTEQAALFSERYESLASSPYSSSFAYSRHRLQVLLARLLPSPRASACLLDVGCGTGHHLAWARSRGFEVTGVDGSDAMLVEARRLNPGVTFERSDVAELPFASGRFDAILCIEVLRYLAQTDPCIRELARVLRPGGTCFATASPLFNLNGFPLLNRAGLLFRSLGLVRLKQFFHTTVGLKRRFTRAGFREVAVHGVYLGLCNWVEKVAPRTLPGLLRRVEPYDALLSDLPIVRDLSGMLLVHAIR
jgi:ubiquinone/menaquinone biosynthesis C-methylase UbiE